VSAPAGFCRPPQTICLANHLCCLHTLTDNSGLDLHQDCGGHKNPAGTQKSPQTAVPQFADLETTAVPAICSEECMLGSDNDFCFLPPGGRGTFFGNTLPRRAKLF
jgi:hypothetical protein